MRIGSPIHVHLFGSQVSGNGIVWTSGSSESLGWGISRAGNRSSPSGMNGQCRLRTSEGIILFDNVEIVLCGGFLRELLFLSSLTPDEL